MLSPSLPRVAMTAGLPARYLYFSGRSGSRYLFTCMGLSAAADFESGVAIAVSGREIVWIGEVSELGQMPEDSLPLRAEIYVHLLAPTLSARRAVIEDLSPEEPLRLRLAA